MTDELARQLIEDIRSLTTAVQRLTSVMETRSEGPSSHKIVLRDLLEAKYGTGPDTL